MKRFGGVIAAAIAVGLIVSATAWGAPAKQEKVEGEGRALEPVAHIPWKSGTDMELTTIKGRDYAFAYARAALADGGGLHVIDVTNPEKPDEVAWLECVLSQGDVQISHDQKTIVIAADSLGGQEGCLGVGKSGFMTVDISNPKKPKAIGFAEIPRGSHNITTHPKKPYVYNSDSDVDNGVQHGGTTGEIQIWSIKNPAKPKLVNTVLSLPHSPHDISFNAKGDRAVTAAVSHFDIWDTSDVENPTLLFTGQCPGCTITHDAKFTPDGTHIFIGDEAGGGAPFPCPGGALYAYMMNGDIPILVGVYEPSKVGVAQVPPVVGGCTSHVFEISDDSKNLAIAWYTAGVYYLDITNPHGVTIGEQGTGIREVGYFIPKGGSTWSAKLHDDGYVYTNDINLGFIVYRVGD